MHSSNEVVASLKWIGNLLLLILAVLLLILASNSGPYFAPVPSVAAVAILGFCAVRMLCKALAALPGLFADMAATARDTQRARLEEV